ncbi:DUF6896 domain-containing protein [Kiloniella majae]|uniref:DUF6896 domain-containing protein n=1 Tax=Kiloniella majae TaxID=1938558 RepID=UPI000A2784D3|nr:hypothetical protein [Kiloniella majae]
MSEITSKFIRYIEKFVFLQNALWQELGSTITEPIDQHLLNVPRTGLIQFRNTEWQYQKHGGGVLFKEVNGKMKIDFHKVEKGENSFDAWGLATYFGALGGDGRKVLKSVGIQKGPYDDQLDQLLSNLADQNILINKGSFYQLK